LCPGRSDGIATERFRLRLELSDDGRQLGVRSAPGRDDDGDFGDCTLLGCSLENDPDRPIVRWSLPSGENVFRAQGRAGRPCDGKQNGKEKSHGFGVPGWVRNTRPVSVNVPSSTFW
jgi:hypothetical protein